MSNTDREAMHKKQAKKQLFPAKLHNSRGEGTETTAPSPAANSQLGQPC